MDFLAFSVNKLDHRLGVSKCSRSRYDMIYDIDVTQSTLLGSSLGIIQRVILPHFHSLHTHSQMIKCSRVYWSDVNMSETKVLILCDFILSDIPTSWLAFGFAYAVVRVGERFDQVWHEWLLQCCSLCAFMAMPLYCHPSYSCILLDCTSFQHHFGLHVLWDSSFACLSVCNDYEVPLLHAAPTCVTGEWCLECCTTAVSAFSLSCSMVTE